MYQKDVKRWFERGSKKLLIFHGMTNSKNCILCTVSKALSMKKPVYVGTSVSNARKLNKYKKVRAMPYSTLSKRKFPHGSVIIVDGALNALKYPNMKRVLSQDDKKVVILGRNPNLLNFLQMQKLVNMLGSGRKRIMDLKKLEPNAFPRIVNRGVKRVEGFRTFASKLKLQGKSQVVAVNDTNLFQKALKVNGFKRFGTNGGGKKYAVMDKKGIEAFNNKKVKLMVIGPNDKGSELKGVTSLHMFGKKIKNSALDKMMRYKKSSSKTRYLNLYNYNIGVKRRVKNTRPVKKPENKPVKKSKNVTVKGPNSKRLEKFLNSIGGFKNGPQIEIIQ